MKKGHEGRKFRRISGQGRGPGPGTAGRDLPGAAGDPMQELRPTVWIGKSGCTDPIIAEIADQLEHRKQVKVKWLRNADVSPHEIAARAGAVLLGVRGRTMVLAKRRTVDRPG